MDFNTIEQILSELVMRAASYFKMDTQDALAAVATSRLANELSLRGNLNGLSIDELSQRLYAEISIAE